MKKWRAKTGSRSNRTHQITNSILMINNEKVCIKSSRKFDIFYVFIKNNPFLIIMVFHKKLVKIMAKFNTPVLFQVQSFSQALAQLANEPEFGRVQSIQGLHPMHSSLQE